MNRTLLAMKSSLSLPIVCVREGSDCLHRRNGYPACKGLPGLLSLCAEEWYRSQSYK